MNDDQLKILTKRLDQIQDVCNRIDRDFDHAIKDSQELTLRVGALEQEIQQLKENISRIPTKVGDKVDDAMKDVKQEAQDLKKAIQEKKIVKMFIKRSWWKPW
jgi:uncharacterized protein YoxC